MLKKVLISAAAGAVALGGLAFLGAGGASAGKPVLSGTLHCTTTGTTTFSPGGVLSLAQLAKPKDKKVKVTTHTAFSACTGSEPSSGLPVPTSGTSDSKSKLPSRLCQGFTSLGGGKTKYLFGGTSKSKGGLPGTTTTKVDADGNPATLGDDLTIPPVTDPGFNAFLVANGAKNLVSVGTGGTLAGKAYAGKVTSTRSVAGGLVSKVVACTSPTGLTTVSSTGVEGIGVPA